MTVFRGNAEDKFVYMKKQAYLIRDKILSTRHAGCTRQEISWCELISKTPHPNLAQYLGVETRIFPNYNGEEERVTRIAYKKYSMDLDSFVILKRYLQPCHVDFLMQGIEKGMKRLQNLGLVHCGLRPANVFMSFESERDKNQDVVLKEVVIGDFDASVQMGERVSLKRASKDWWPKSAGKEWGMKAEQWIDEWCLEKMRKWLKEDGLGEWDFGGEGEGDASWSQGSIDGMAEHILETLANNGW